MKQPRLWAACGAAIAVLIALAAAVNRAPALLVADVPREGRDPKDAEVEKARDYAGKYLAEGVTAGGKKYRAMVEITREGDVYDVTWVLGPREAYSGVGITEGNALCVGWSSGQVPGLVVYKPENEKLVGRWTAPGSQGKIFRETLSPVK